MRYTQPIIKVLFGLATAGIIALTPNAHLASEQNEVGAIEEATVDYSFRLKNPSFKDLTAGETLELAQGYIERFCAAIPKEKWDQTKYSFDQTAGALCGDPSFLKARVTKYFQYYAANGFDSAGHDAPVVEGYTPLSLVSPKAYLNAHGALRSNLDVQNYETFNTHDNDAAVREQMKPFLALASDIKDPLFKLMAVNQYVNTVIKYDQEKRDSDEIISKTAWVDPVARILREKDGVCVDFVALKTVMLHALGFPSSDIWSLSVLTSDKEYHAVVGVKNPQGLYILNSPTLGYESIEDPSDLAVILTGPPQRAVDFFGPLEKTEFSEYGGNKLLGAYNITSKRYVPYSPIHSEAKWRFVESNNRTSPSHDDDSALFTQITALALKEHNAIVKEHNITSKQPSASKTSQKKQRSAMEVGRPTGS